MVSTVSTTVTTVVTTSAAGLVASIGMAAVVTLIASLSMSEVLAGAGNRLALFARNLDTVIAPLVFVFLFIVTIELWQILS